MGGIIPRHLKHRRRRIQRIDGVTVAGQRDGDEPGAASDFEDPGIRMKIEVLYPAKSGAVAVPVNCGQQPVVGIHRLPVRRRRFEIIGNAPLASRAESCILQPCSRRPILNNALIVLKIFRKGLMENDEHIRRNGMMSSAAYQAHSCIPR